MSSERMYSLQEVREIMAIKEEYSAWAEDYTKNGFKLHSAIYILERMRKYPLFFEKLIASIQLRVDAEKQFAPSQAISVKE
jgi:hypothetical protein